MEPTRLFDLLEYRKETCPERAVLTYKSNGEWTKIFIDEYIAKVNAVSYAFLKLGVAPGENIVLISGDRPEWNFTDMGVQQTGAVLVPVYPTISGEEYEFILNDCSARFIVVDSFDILRRLKPVISRLEKVEAIYVLNHLTDEQQTKLNDFELGAKRVETFDSLLALGESNPDAALLDERRRNINPRDVATMIYTSGTTGQPKGVMLCHENILFNLHGVKNTPKDYFSRAMTFLPLCHIFERMMNYFYQFMGYETYYAENIGKVVENLKDARPYMMCAVPRVIEKMYDGIYRKGEKMKGVSKKIFFWAIDLASEFELEGNSLWFNIRRKVADKLVYSKIRENFGGCLEMFVSGGSAIQPRLARFFTCIGMDIYAGYGLTETAPVIAVSARGVKGGRKIGTVGLPLPGVEVKIDPDTKEIMCRGKNVMIGYYGHPESTAAVIDSDGWFHTGDTGLFEPEGQLSITGRTKTMFKTSMGKYVNPEVLEDKFKESPFILDMMVVGENQKFAAAIVVPDFHFLKEWQERHDIHCNTNEEMITDKRTLERYQRVIDKYNKTLGATEQIKRFKVINDVWDTENGCLTPTLKIKRNVVTERCQHYIDDLFR